MTQSYSNVQSNIATHDRELLFEAQATLIRRFRNSFVDLGDEGERELLLLLNDLREMLDLEPYTEQEWRNVLGDYRFSTYL